VGTCQHNMPPGFTRRWAFLAPATLAAILCIGLVCRRHSHGPSLLLEKYVGGKAEPGIPRTWISNKDMADSPMLHSSSSSASLPGQGILSSATHPERISLASAPPSGALAAAQRQGQEKSHLAPKAASGPSLRREDKGDAIPSKVQDLKNQGLKQVAPFLRTYFILSASPLDVSAPSLHPHTLPPPDDIFDALAHVQRRQRLGNGERGHRKRNFTRWS
jgi:hypothetical protein